MSLTDNIRLKYRKKTYKLVLSAEEARGKREKSLLQIRKDKRERNLLQKRRRGQPQEQDPSATLNNHPVMVTGVWSDVATLQLEATIQFRKFLSTQRSQHIDEVIHSGVVTRFGQFLTWHKFPELQFEATWALSRISLGTSQQASVVIDHGAVPLFVHLLIHSPDDDIREQSVLALGNVARHSSEFRDVVLRHGALMPVLAELNHHATLYMLRAAAWDLSNFCSDLTDGMEEIIEFVIDTGVCPRLVELLQHSSSDVVHPALQVVRNIIRGNCKQMQTMIDNKVLPCIFAILTNNDQKKSIKKEACWTISNITARSKEQIEAVIDAAASNCRIRYQGCIGPLCDLLDCSDPKIVKAVCLDGLENILEVGETEKKLGHTGGMNLCAQHIVDLQGLKTIENLLNHKNNEVYEKAVQILETFWPDDLEE